MTVPTVFPESSSSPQAKKNEIQAFFQIGDKNENECL